MKVLDNKQLIVILVNQQIMKCYLENELLITYPISSGKNGVGEIAGSECTPRGWHRIYSIIGRECEENSVFIARKWTGEIYSEALALKYPGRDWILTRILQLEGREPGRNQGENVDSLQRYIYVHGTPDTTPMGIPNSKGCIRMRNKNIMALAEWIHLGANVYIE